MRSLTPCFQTPAAVIDIVLLFCHQKYNNTNAPFLYTAALISKGADAGSSSNVFCDTTTFVSRVFREYQKNRIG